VRVLLVDVDSTWANLALMKLSAYHKSLGDEIHLLRLRRKWRPKLGKPIIIEERPPILDCDRAYISCIYPKNRNLAFSMEKMFVSLGMKVVLGGSGIDLHIKLPNYIEHILPDYSLYGLDYSMGFLCYDPKTEVLTSKGWKLIKNVTYKDKICTLNPRTHEIEYQHPLEIVKEYYSGNLI